MSQKSAKKIKNKVEKIGDGNETTKKVSKKKKAERNTLSGVADDWETSSLKSTQAVTPIQPRTPLSPMSPPPINTTQIVPQTPLPLTPFKTPGSLDKMQIETPIQPKTPPTPRSPPPSPSKSAKMEKTQKEDVKKKEESGVELKQLEYKSKLIIHAMVIFARSCKMEDTVVNKISEKLFDEDLPATIDHTTVETITSSISVDIRHSIRCATTSKVDPSCITMESFRKNLEKLKKTVNVAFSIDDVKKGLYVNVRHLGRSLVHLLDLV